MQGRSCELTSVCIHRFTKHHSHRSVPGTTNPTERELIPQTKLCAAVPLVTTCCTSHSGPRIHLAMLEISNALLPDEVESDVTCTLILHLKSVYTDLSKLAVTKRRNSGKRCNSANNGRKPQKAHSKTESQPTSADQQRKNRGTQTRPQAASHDKKHRMRTEAAGTEQHCVLM